MKSRSDHLAWAEHLDWMEGLRAAHPEEARAKNPDHRFRSRWLGLAVAIALAVAATKLNHLPVWPFMTASGRHPLDPILLTVLLGIVIGNVGRWGDACKAGASLAVKQLQPLGIILLGARLDFMDLLAIGTAGILLSCLQVVMAFVLFLGLIRWWKLPWREGMLLGAGTAICGGTAIVALAPVVKARESEVAVTVATVTLLGLIAMLALPAVAALTGMDARTFGIWAGLTIHQTPQVIAAGFAHSAEAGQAATIIKLARVCLLGPVVLAAGLWSRRRGVGTAGSARPWWRLFPMFVLGFAGLSLLRTLGLLPVIDLHWEALRLLPGFSAKLSLPEMLNSISGFLLAVSMAGVGLETRVADLRRSSFRSIGLAGFASLILCVLALAAIRASA